MKLEKGDIVRYIGKHPSIKGLLFSVKGFWGSGEIVAKELESNDRLIFNPDDVEKVEELEE